MKVILFGTGNIYQKYKKFIDMESVICFIDNNKQKNHKVIDSLTIFYPAEVDFENCDYVIIMADCYAEMQEQLIQCGVEEHKIKDYSDLGELYHIDINVNCCDKLINMQEWLDKNNRRKVFVLSHSQTRTGAPMALMNLSMQLKDIGYDVLYGALDEGNMAKELKIENVDFIENIVAFYKNTKFLELLKRFDMLILSTIVLSDVGKFLTKLSIPVIWWLHESEREYYKKHALPTDNCWVHYYAVGKRVENIFKEFYPTEYIGKLPYCLPDISFVKQNNKKKFTILFIGWYQKRKGIDVLLNAIELMPENKRKQANFMLICPGFNEEICKVIEKFPEISLLGEQSQEEISNIYKQADLLVCPSRDDPMPIVVTQAMQYGIPCIVSDQVGQSEFYVDNYGGYVFEDENFRKLSELMVYCIEHPLEMIKKGQEAYEIFISNFSAHAMKKSLKRIIHNISL